MQLSLPLLLSILSTLSAAAPLEKRAAKPIQLDFSVVAKNSTADGPKSIYHRNAVNLPLENEYALYLADIEIGTPGQKIRIDVDTGSSDLWVPAVGTVSNSGTFDASKSSSYKKVQDGFKIGYGDGSQAFGNWAKESVTLGGVTLNDVEFGYASNQTAKQAIMGVGFPGNEASDQQKNGSFTYDNFPIQLKKQGAINKVSYSLYLNSKDAASGSILFGGVDHAKYEDELYELDIVNIDDSGSATEEAVAFFVNLDGITQGKNTLATKQYPALLDSGTTLIYAPNDIATAFGKKYGHKVPFANAYIASCDTSGDDFEFKFGDKTIKVPFQDLLFHINGKQGTPFLNQCLIGVMGSGSDYYILGDNFLRSAYIHYDLEDKKIGIAQVKYTDESSIESD